MEVFWTCGFELQLEFQMEFQMEKPHRQLNTGYMALEHRGVRQK